MMNNLGCKYDLKYFITELDDNEVEENNDGIKVVKKLIAMEDAEVNAEIKTCEVEVTNNVFKNREAITETTGMLELEMICKDPDLSDKENICNWKNLIVTKDPTGRWTDFILYSTLIIADVKNKFNPYLADAQDAVNFLSCYRRRYSWDYHTLTAYMGDAHCKLQGTFLKLSPF